MVFLVYFYNHGHKWTVLGLLKLDNIYVHKYLMIVELSRMNPKIDSSVSILHAHV